MAKLSKKKLERLAVDAVNFECNKPNFNLSGNIPVGDKGISFDGDIEVSKDASESVGSLIGKVPVQVKGKQVTKFSNSNITFSMSLDHLSNYYDSHGVVLFVVEIKSGGETKIYYKQLLPTELREILKKFGEEKKQKQRSLELRPLLETNIDIVCRKFLQESKRQSLVLIEHNPFKDEEFNAFNLTSLTFNPKKIETSNIFEHDFTLYGIKETLSVPLKQARIHSYTTKIKDRVFSNGNEYEFDIEVTEEQDQTILLIEKTLQLTFSSDKFNFNINQFVSLSAQLKIVPFVLDFLTSTSITFASLSVKLENIKLKDSTNTIQQFNNILNTLNKLKIVFNSLNIPEEIEINNDSGSLNDFIDQITGFVKMYIDNDYSSFKIDEPETAKFTLLNIGGLNLVFFYNPDSSPKIINAFSQELLNTDSRLSVNGNHYPYSPFIMLNDEALAKGVNVNLKFIRKSFDSFEPFLNEMTSSVTNDFCLMLINAFDKSKKQDILELASHIYNKYKGKHLEKSIVIINQAQIKIRLKNRLEDDDLRKIMQLKHSEPENLEVQFCTSVLLESKHESKMFFDQFEPSRQEYYQNLPIYKLCSFD